MKIDAHSSNTAKKRTSRRRRRTILLYPLGFLLALGLFLLWIYRDITPVVYGEYGEDLPPVTAFCQTKGAVCLPDEDSAALGDHVVRVVVRYRVVPCLLKIRDTTAPAADPVPVSFPAGYEPTPDEFITDLKDADVVGVSFAQAYDFSETGEHEIVIALEDGSGNRGQVTAMASVRATRNVVTVEAGSPAPASEAFCDDGFHGTLLSEITEAMLHAPGEYPVDVQCAENGRIYPSVLRVRDTAAPAATGRMLALRPGEEAAPEDFLSDIADETALTCAFLTAPDPDRRDMQDILIRVTDAGGNATDVPAQVFYTSIAPVTVEVKNDRLTAEDIGVPGGAVEDLSADTPGTYTVHVRDGNGQEQLALVTLADTTPPVLSMTAGTYYTKHPLSPETLLTASDVGRVSRLEYVVEPDWNSTAEQSFRARAVDASGNESVAEFSLTLLSDETAPKLYGVMDRICYVGEPVLYLKEAYGEDDVDGRLELSVDSQVISSQPGSYPVTYTATDQSGNAVSKSCTFTLVTPTTSEEELDALVEAALKKIIKPNMVTAEKLKAVFTYVQRLLRYADNSDKSDWRKEAVRGFTKKKGDCFTFYSVTRALLDKLEIPYMSVTRLGGATRHYWMIVNIGTGWYHFDTFTDPSSPKNCFMWTNLQISLMPKFWHYAEEEYPPIATETFNYKAVVRMEREGLLP